MEIKEIEAKITQRAKLLIEIQERSTYRDSLRKQVLAKIPKEIQDELDAIDAEFSTSSASETISKLEEEIKAGVLKVGATVKVPGVGMAVFNKGRVTWTTAALEGFLVSVPELGQFRKIGEPYVTFK
jgi:hypothetical protein